MASTAGLKRLPSVSSQASIDVGGGPTDRETDFATFDEIDADLSLR